MPEKLENPNIRIYLTPLPPADNDIFADILGAPPLAYDVQILTPQASVGDYLQAIEDFQAQTLADCKGCDGCCHERAPLTIADWQLAQNTHSDAEPTEQELADWLLEWAELHFCGPAVDLTLKRTPAGTCNFLHEQQKYCTRHQQRSFTCRTHCCLPKTERAEALRAALINAGEDELVRRLLQMPAAVQPWSSQLASCKLEDYAANAFSRLPINAWRQARIQDLLDKADWELIYQPTAGAE